MSQRFLQRKLRLGIHFWIIYGVTVPIVLYLFAPWRWNLPAVSKIAGIVGLPFLFAVVIYVLALFVYGIFAGPKLTKVEIQSLIIVALFCLCGTAVITFVKSLSQYRFVLVIALGTSAILLYESLCGWNEGDE